MAKIGLAFFVAFAFLCTVSESRKWRMCYICSGMFPDRQCELHPREVTQGPGKINCTRAHCTSYVRYKPNDDILRFDENRIIVGTTRPMTPGDFSVHSIARECEEYGRGNGCELDGDSMGITCYTTCDYDFCNDVTTRPQWEMFRKRITTAFPGATSKSVDLTASDATSTSTTTTRAQDKVHSGSKPAEKVPKKESNDIVLVKKGNSKSEKGRGKLDDSNGKENGQGKTKQKKTNTGSKGRSGRRGAKTQELNAAPPTVATPGLVIIAVTIIGLAHYTV